MPYTFHKLPGLAFAVTDQNGKSWCVCDRQEDAERIAYCLRIVEESEATAIKDEVRRSELSPNQARVKLGLAPIVNDGEVKR